MQLNNKAFWRSTTQASDRRGGLVLLRPVAWIWTALYSILLSGTLYQFGGLQACLAGSAAMLAASWAATLALPTTPTLRPAIP